MRELKFRFWDGEKFESKMGITENGEIVDLGECFQNEAGKNGEHYTVQQYTGFKDINNKEIYEGDIGIYHCPDIVIMKYPEEECEIIWKENGWHVRHKNNLFLWVVDEKFCAKSFEIVGNIFENPELLKL